jgi:hypothetical protein
VLEGDFMVVPKPSWFALAAVASLALVPARGGDQPTKTYRNPTFMISLKVFPEWTQVPIEITEKYSIAKFYEPGSRGDMFQPELEVLRLDKRGAAAVTGPVTGVDPKTPKTREEIERALEEASRPKSVFELAFSRIAGPEGQKPDPKASKKIVSADKVEGKLWVHESSPYGGGNPKDKTRALVVALVAFEKEGIEYGIRISGTARRREDFEAAIKTIGKSFLFFDPKAKQLEALDVLEGVNITAKRRGEIEKGLITGWGIEVSPKKNYVVIYNTKKNKNRQLARTIADRIEKIREQVYEVQFPPAQPVKTVSIVRVCGDRTEYFAYGGPGGSAGYWNSYAEELVFYDASPARKVDDDTLAVLYHEAFHQYIFYSVGSVAPHSWFNEGHGDYYAGSKYISSGKFKIGPFDWRVGTVKNAIAEGPRASEMKKDASGVEKRVYTGNHGYTPLKDLVAFSQRDYYSYPGVSYAQGWSLIYFLREGVPKNKQWNAKWGKILDKYFNALKREVNKEGRLVRGGDGPEKPGPNEPPDPKGPPRPKGPPEPPKGPDAPPADPKTGPDAPKPGPDAPPAPKDPPADPANPSDPTKPADPADPSGPDQPKDPQDPPKGPDDPEGGSDEPAPDPGLQPMQEGEASESALEIALREAFEGVNFDELEAAWLDFTKHGK